MGLASRDSTMGLVCRSTILVVVESTSAVVMWYVCQVYIFFVNFKFESSLQIFHSVTFNDCAIDVIQSFSDHFFLLRNQLFNIHVVDILYGFYSVCEQKSLTPGANQLLGANVRNYAKWKRTYQPGLSWGGVENCYLAVDIKHGPHAGVLGDGTCNNG